jgi:uncharacterized membrane protein
MSHEPTHTKFSRRREIITSYKARSDARRTTWERLADVLTSRFGTVSFLALNALWFIGWMLWNTGKLGLDIFDPYPFGLLTMIVSLEAIILAVTVLISQNRAAHVADMREEIELQISMTAEEEITKIMNMLCLLLDKQGIDVSHDSELTRMLKPISNQEIEKRIEEELE